MKRRSSPRLQGYRYHKQKLLEAGKHPSQHAIRSRGVLAAFMSGDVNGDARAALDRTERLLRLLLDTPAKPVSSKRRIPKKTKGEAVAAIGPAP
ncbi:hypothetical protein A1D31_39265 [Bradyrhizobium liaoningense]|nr:hypothetical protein A1D31_39265 [Bradyrhizobium liaoningense]